MAAASRLESALGVVAAAAVGVGVDVLLRYAIASLVCITSCHLIALIDSPCRVVG